MKRFTINCYGTVGRSNPVGDKFPLQTYRTDFPETVIVCLQNLFANNVSGINRVEICDAAFGKVPESEIGQSPMDI